MDSQSSPHKCQHSCIVVVSSSVEGDTNQDSNPGGSKKNPLTGNPQKIVARHQPVAPVVGLGPPTREVVAVVANPVDHGQPRLRCVPIGIG